MLSYVKFLQAVRCYDPDLTPSTEQSQGLMDGYSSAGINSKDELTMFLTQVIWESGGLVHKEEITPPSHGYRVPGDPTNKSYHGRGYIQLTGSENYRKFSEFWFKDDKKLVNKPELVASKESLSWGSAFWYWGRAVHDQWKKGFEYTSKAINPNYECLCGPYPEISHARFDLYSRVCRVLGVEVRGQVHWPCHHTTANTNPVAKKGQAFCPICVEHSAAKAEELNSEI